MPGFRYGPAWALINTNRINVQRFVKSTQSNSRLLVGNLQQSHQPNQTKMNVFRVAEGIEAEVSREFLKNSEKSCKICNDIRFRSYRVPEEKV